MLRNYFVITLYLEYSCLISNLTIIKANIYFLYFCKYTCD